MGKIKLKKKDDWPTRLAEFLEKKKAKNFKLGRNDCGVFALGAIKAMSGKDLTPEWVGAPEDEIYETLKIYGGLRGAAEMIAEATNLEKVKSNYEQRGDIILFQLGHEDTLGLISLDPKYISALTFKGLRFFPKSHLKIIHCWRIP